MHILVVIRFRAIFPKTSNVCIEKWGGAGTHKTRVMETNAKEQIPEIFKPKAFLWVKLEQVTLSTSCNSKTKKYGKIRKIRK